MNRNDLQMALLCVRQAYSDLDVLEHMDANVAEAVVAGVSMLLKAKVVDESLRAKVSEVIDTTDLMVKSLGIDVAATAPTCLVHAIVQDRAKGSLTLGSYYLRQAFDLPIPLRPTGSKYVAGKR
jgi:hypothetical protein